MKQRTYIDIDLKSFFASVECVERGLDALTTHLVVADAARTEKTICLAVSPSLKACGLPGRPRLFEVVQQVAAVNAVRRQSAPGGVFTGSSHDATLLKRAPELAVDYIVAPPRMACYLQYSARIYQIYLRHVAPEDIHVYSIDEVFIDATDYLTSYRLTAREFAMQMILEVLRETGITATAGIGSNLYLCKVAMDIEAKHIQPDRNGVRIARLTEETYRRLLWDHRPLTDFWRVGRGYAKKLEQNGLYTMGDIARCSLGRPDELHNEELLYRLFGVNAELLIDHAWGWEPCTIADIKAYRPRSGSLCSGQVLPEPYECEKARLIVREMTDLLSLDLVEKGLVCSQLVLDLGYDAENLSDAARRRAFRGQIAADAYGRAVPKAAHGSVNLEPPTASARQLMTAAAGLFDRIAAPGLLVRRIAVTANRVLPEEAFCPPVCEQLDLFTDYAARQEQQERERAALARERSGQQAVIALRKKYGKNAVLRGMDLLEGATTVARNGQIGGHKA